MKKILFLTLFSILSVTGNLIVAQGQVHNDALTVTDGWQLIPSGVTENLNAVHFANATHGYIGGNWARCLKSTNGGLNWSPLNVPSFIDFQCIWATSPDRVHIGAWDTIWNSQNGGASWYGTHTNTVNFMINDLQFHSVDLGYAFLPVSAFIKTTDGGASWSDLTGCGVIDDFLAGYMVDQNIGYGVGTTSIIGKTIDGGATWTQYEWNGWTEWTPIEIEGVHFTTALKGIAVADSGVIFRTNDGGAYWSRSTIAGPEDRLKDIYFVNANVGFIVGYNGLIFKTTDGGDNWFQEPLLTGNNLNSVFFISETLGWVVGDNGTILRYGGASGVENQPGSSRKINLEVLPNPISSSSAMMIDIPTTMDVDVSIYDLSGRMICTIYKGSLPGGQNRIPFELSGLSSGSYLCKLIFPEGVTSKTLIIQ